jgi:hypothetical protein
VTHDRYQYFPCDDEVPFGPIGPHPSLDPVHLVDRLLLAISLLVHRHQLYDGPPLVQLSEHDELVGDLLAEARERLSQATGRQLTCAETLALMARLL